MTIPPNITGTLRLAAPKVMLRARWKAWLHVWPAFWHHRIWRLEVQRRGHLFYDTEAVFCDCGKEFH